MKFRFANILHSVCFLAISFCTASCDKTNEPEIPVECRRTVLVYQVANNNLGTSRYNEMDIEEMREGAAAGKIPSDGRLLVYNAGPNANPLLLEIKSNGVDTLKTYSTDILSVTSQRMYQVFDDVAAFAPSKEFGLVLWSHGSGWLQDGMADEALMPKSFGSEKGHTMNITTLAEVLRNGPELSFVYFDCCYMASVETFYELRDVAPVIIGSATELLVYGMPYDRNIEHFYSDKKALVEAARNTFNLYNSLSGSSRTCTMSVVDTSSLLALAHATANIFSRVDAALPSGYRPQRFMSYDVATCYYFDMADYVRALCLAEDGSERFNGARDLYDVYESALGKCVLYQASTPRLWNEVNLEHHCGLSTYIVDEPSKLTKKNYNTLQWYNDVVSKLNF